MAKPKLIIRGLSSVSYASNVQVFKANPDGSKGEFLREEPPTYSDYEGKLAPIDIKARKA